MFSGTVRTRDRVRFGRDRRRKGDRDRRVRRRRDRPARVRVCRADREALGSHGDPDRRRDRHAARDRNDHQFAPPTLETVVVPVDPGDKGALRDALAQLAEQDPLINVRQDDTVNEISVSLYGEVQKEVIEATLATDFGVDVTFRETTTIYIERPIGTGAAVEVLRGETNPFSATIGLRVEPAPVGSGVDFRLDVDPREVPTHIYKTARQLRRVHDAVRAPHVARGPLRLAGHRLRRDDERVRLLRVGRSESRRTTPPRTTAADFRKLTPLVLMRRARAGRRRWCANRWSGSASRRRRKASARSWRRWRGSAASMSRRRRAGDLATIATTMPAARAQDLQRQVPGLTGGEGVVETDFVGYGPVSGAADPTPDDGRPAQPRGVHEAGGGAAHFSVGGCGRRREADRDERGGEDEKDRGLDGLESPEPSGRYVAVETRAGDRWSEDPTSPRRVGLWLRIQSPGPRADREVLGVSSGQTGVVEGCGSVCERRRSRRSSWPWPEWSFARRLPCRCRGRGRRACMRRG